MIRFIIRRLILLVPLLFGASVLVFLTMRLIPGDPARLALGAEATEDQVQLMRRQWGLDQPLPVQYVYWIGHALQGDWGRSTVSRVPATEEIANRLPATLRLAALSIVFAIVLGIGFGLLAAVRHNTWLDRASMVMALLGICTPSFWLGLMLILVFSVWLGWFPSFGQDGLDHLVLPSLTLGAAAAALIARVTRSSLLEVLGADYLKTARAKGLAEHIIITRHALKNALIPVLTLLGLELGGLLTGAIVTETVFAYPGIGLLLISSIGNRDFAVVQPALLLFALQFVLINLLVDVLYAVVDPRITYA
ncbi:MAG: ABC transporter permease [Chloroflexi bacterium]|nr:ABC transporter permease [Chloroflexota bacterium]